MRLLIDANVYIFGLGFFKKDSCEALLKLLTETFPLHSVCICRTITEEVKANLTQKEFHNFFRFINIISKIDEDFLISFELGAKYESRGLKSADSLIAAYTEWVGADILVTENRHFLSRQGNLPFKVLNSQNTAKLIKTSVT